MSRQKTSVAYTLGEAAVATSISEDKIRAACERLDLASYFVGVKRIIRAADLDEWIQTLPTERAS